MIMMGNSIHHKWIYPLFHISEPFVTVFSIVSSEGKLADQNLSNYLIRKLCHLSGFYARGRVEWFLFVSPSVARVCFMKTCPCNILSIWKFSQGFDFAHFFYQIISKFLNSLVSVHVFYKVYSDSLLARTLNS